MADKIQVKSKISKLAVDRNIQFFAWFSKGKALLSQGTALLRQV